MVSEKRQVENEISLEEFMALLDQYNRGRQNKANPYYLRRCYQIAYDYLVNVGIRGGNLFSAVGIHYYVDKLILSSKDRYPLSQQITMFKPPRLQVEIGYSNFGSVPKGFKESEVKEMPGNFKRSPCITILLFEKRSGYINPKNHLALQFAKDGTSYVNDSNIIGANGYTPLQVAFKYGIDLTDNESCRKRPSGNYMTIRAEIGPSVNFISESTVKFTGSALSVADKQKFRFYSVSIDPRLSLIFSRRYYYIGSGASLIFHAYRNQSAFNLKQQGSFHFSVFLGIPLVKVIRFRYRVDYYGAQMFGYNAYNYRYRKIY